MLAKMIVLVSLVALACAAPQQQVVAAVPEICLLPPLADPNARCNTVSVMHYYDVNTKDCEEILYSGCGGSANLFATEDACEIVCEDVIDRLNSLEISVEDVSLEN